MRPLFFLSLSLLIVSCSLYSEEKATPKKEKAVQEKKEQKNKDQAAKDQQKSKKVSHFNSKLSDMDLRLGLKAGTLGIGHFLSTPIAEKHHLRLNLNYLAFDRNFTEDALNYEADITFFTAGLLYDYFPANGKLRLTTGLYYNGNKADIKNENAGNFSLNGTTYSLTRGALKGEVEYNPIAPYVGIGYDHAIMDNNQWSFSMDLGLFYQGDADVNVDVSGASAAQANIQDNADAEARELEKDLNNYSYFPVLAFGVTYRY